MSQKKQKKIKDLIGLGFKTGQVKGNIVKPVNEFPEFKKEDIEQSVAERFESIVKKHPNKTAVKVGHESVTYEELNRRANRTSHAILDTYDDRYVLSVEEKTRYARQMMLHGWGVQAQEKLKSTTVFAAGAGGSGSPLIMQLALLGVGTIIVCDFDDVDLSNLNRQVLHDESRIGMNKALSAKKSVEKINPNVRVVACPQKITAETVDELVGDAAVIFDNVDDIEAKFVLSRCAVKKGIPHIISSMIDMDAYAAVFHPPFSPCFHCLYDPGVLDELDRIKQYSLDSGKQYETLPNPVASPSLFLATGIAVNEAVKIILGFDNIAYNKFFFFDQRGSEFIVDTQGYRKITYPFSRFFRQLCKEQGFDWDEGKPGDIIKELTVAPDPDCPVCSGVTEAAVNSSGCESEKVPADSSIVIEGQKGERTAALLFGQGIDMVTGILGVLKSGLIYVPLDAGYPEERLTYMLEDSGARLIVTNGEFFEAAVKLRDKVNKNIGVIDINALPGNLCEENPGHAVDSCAARVSIKPEDPAYILYTSGSTGRPKGVIQSHRNVLHFARVYTNALHLHPGDKLTLFSSYSFDAAKMDIYGALLNGAELHPYDIKAEGNLRHMPQWLRDEGITIYHSIPTVYRYFTDMLNDGETNGFPGLRFIVLGGEAVFKKDVDNYKRFFAPDCLFINGLGPTESTVTLQYFIDKNTEITREAVPVGFAVDETEVYLLNDQDREPGVFGVGEIVFKSDYLARGYWNQPTQTEKVFVTDPVTGKGRVYRTGDLGRRLPDGGIEYAGRKDFQVKVSGYRVELGEIESKLDGVPGIQKSVVVCRKDDNSENFLAAYYTTAEENEVDENQLASILRTVLPDYMVPALFLYLQEFPLTATGKIDRKTLSDQDISHFLQTEEDEPPTNETEEQLLELWKDVLKKESIGVNRNFFVLGGNSIKAILLASRIHKTFDVEISLTEIFKRPTVREQAVFLAGVTYTDKRVYEAITRVEKRDHCPLSSAQERLYFLNSFEDIGTRFNIFTGLTITGALDLPRFNKVMAALIERHEALRTSFHLLDGRPVQRVHDNVDFSIDVFPGFCSQESSELVKDFVRAFDLTQAPLLRAGIFSRSEEEHLMLFDIHHIVFDGTSMDILVRDFTRLYEGDEPERLAVQYRDFALWQKDRFRGQRLHKAEEYWLDVYSDILSGELPQVPRVNLPTDYPRPETMSYEGDIYRFSLDTDVSAALQTMAAKRDMSLFMLLLAVYNVFIAKLSGQEDIISAAVTSGRNHTDTENIIGVFINMLALRNFPRSEKLFSDFLEEVAHSTTASFENQDYPFEMLVEKLPGSRDASRHPLMDIGFTLQNVGLDRTELHTDAGSQFRLMSLKPERKTARNDLNLEGFEIGDRLELEFQYRTELFKKETIAAFAGYLETLFTRLLANPDGAIGDIELITEEEKERLLVTFNDTESLYPDGKTVVDLFEDRVEQSAEGVAVRSTIELQNIYDQLKPEDIDVELYYEELNERANQLAHLLRKRGVGRDTIVGLLLQHPLEKVVGIWGVLKSGGAYLPIDPFYPLMVIRDIFADSGVRILISETGLEETLDEIELPDSVSVIYIDEPEEDYSIENPERLAGLSDLAYIIYTSGTTGRAKGTAIEHRGIVNYARWRLEYFQFTAGDVMLQPLTYSFDSFCANFYAAFLCGGELIMVPDNRRIDYAYIVGLVRQHSATNVCFAPGIYNALLDAAGDGDLDSLRLVVLAGEAAGRELIRKSREKFPRVRLANEYGPTEGTVAATAFPEIDGSSTAIIGSPIANVQVYILNDSLKLSLPGTAGEIFIGGVGVARGYLNNPELTYNKFINKSFAGVQDGTHHGWDLSAPRAAGQKSPLPAGGKYYRTGDLARWLPDGTIEFLGRKDFQVKIRGHRIELEQIETLLVKHGEVKDVLVDARGEGDGRYICAYIVPRDPDVFFIAGVRDYLKERLPYYMIPSHFVCIEKFPLTHNGKINRKALPDPEFTAGDEYVPPRDDTEERLVDIWADVLNLGRENIGIDTNFFDLGGHSLKATMLVSEIQKELDLSVPLSGFFDSPTIRGISGLLGTTSIEESRKKDMVILPAVEKEFYLVSSVQKRLYLLQQMNPMNTGYNNIQPVLVEGTPDGEKMSAVFKRLIKRHEGLRTAFLMVRGEPVQKILEDVPFEILHFDAGTSPDPGPGEIEAVMKEFRQPFDLSQPPLFRVGLAKIREEKYLLLLETHHIISDMISFAIFVKEFADLYADHALPPMELRYRDFSEWQNSSQGKEAAGRQEAYWLKQFENGVPVLNLPLDFPRPEHKHFEGHSIALTLSVEESRDVNRLAHDNGVTPFMLLLAVFNVFLARICGQEQIVVGTPIAGRVHPGLKNIIGMFANTLVLYNCPANEKTFYDFLIEVKRRTLEAYENQEYPFEQLVERLGAHGEAGRNPMFDVMFNYRGADTMEEMSETVLPGLKLHLQDYDSSKSKFDMTLYAQYNGETLHFIFVYSSQLFKPETVEHFAGYYKKILNEVLEDNRKKIADIEILGKERIEKISAEFSEDLENE